jgi:hypothetical protein
MLMCPAGCGRYFIVSEEDPDSTLTDVVHHLTGVRHECSHDEAMRLLANIELADPSGDVS